MADDPGEPSQESHPVAEQILQWFNIVPRFWGWIREEVREVKRAPIAFLVILALGLLGGWFLVSIFKDDELESQKSATAAADQAYKIQQGVIAGYRLEREKLQSQLTGLLPEDVAKQIASNMPPDKRLEGVIFALSNVVDQVESMDALNQPIVSASVVVTAIVPSDKRPNSIYVGDAALVYLSRGTNAMLIAQIEDTSVIGNGRIRLAADCLVESPYFGKPIRSLNDAEYIQIVFKQSSIPLGTLLEGGEVVFTINDRLALRFPINKQVMNTQAKFGEMATLAFVRDIGQGLAPLNHKP